MNLRSIAVLLAFILSAQLEAQRAVIATTDFSTGSLSVIDTETGTATNDLFLIHSDARVRAFKDRVYVVNRLGQDNIIVLDKDDLATPLTQYSTGDGSNPHEIVVVSDDKAYVTLYARSYVLVINPATGDSLGAVDLATFADADGLPEASQMAYFDKHLFVAVQRLDRDAFFSPTDFSTIAVIDTKTDQLVDLNPDTDVTEGITLTATQPFGHAQRGGKWILASVGSFGAQDGGLEVVDLVERTSTGVVISEAALNGDVGPTTMLTDDVGYIVMSDASFANSVVRFDLSAGSVSDPLPDHSGGFTPAIAVAAGSLYVLDRGSFDDPTSAGVKVYDTTTDQLTSGPISTGLPPADIALVDLNPADYDDSGTVDFDDFLLFAAAFGKRQGEAGFESRFDLKPSGLVDFRDFLVFAEHFTR